MIRLHRLSVTHLKAIKQLELRLDVDTTGTVPVTLLTGDNGAGKTTILEAITLLGHIPVFAGGREGSEPLSRTPRETDCTITMEVSLDGETAEVVLFNERARASGLTQSMTRPDELALWSVVTRPENFVGRLREYLNFSRPPARDGGAIPPPTPRVSALRRGEAVDRGIVAYINSDLYELEGPGLDVRETPKDLSRDLARMMVGRLQSYELNDRTPLHFDSLREAFHQIFPDRELFDLTFDEAPDDKEADDLTGHVAVVQLKNRNTGAHWRGDFLSSGENEVLNILMMLISLKVSNSILVMDEPELHLSAPSQRLFFEWLTRFAEENANQIIMTTHSPFLLSPVSKQNLLYVFPNEGRIEVIYEQRWILERMMSFFREWFDYYKTVAPPGETSRG